MSINRIRLEFKAHIYRNVSNLFSCINRIRLEFKDRFALAIYSKLARVLIESDWNLKFVDYLVYAPTGDSINRIRLEFKVITGNQTNGGTITVLIESDWNLK